MVAALRPFWLSAVLSVASAQAVFADWNYYTGTNPDGGARVTASSEENGFHISLQCDAGGDPDVFQLTFVADEFPYLDNTDDAETQLIFRFDGTGKDFVADGWSDVWYFAPDRAWTGSMYFEPGVLDSFGGASTMRVMNMNSQEVARFSMKGSRKAEQAMRAICHQGTTVEQWTASQAQSPPLSSQTEPLPEALRIPAMEGTEIPDFDTVELPVEADSASTKISSDDVFDALLAGDPAVVRDYVLAGFNANESPDYDPGAEQMPLMYFFGIEMIDNPQMQSGMLQLIQGGARTRVDWAGVPSPVVFAVRKENARAAYALIHLGYPVDFIFANGRSVMAEAARLGMTDVVQAILDRGMDPDYAAQEEDPALLYAAAHGYADIVGTLIDARANINATTVQGATALHLAARAGHEQIVRMLVEAGANVELKIGSATAADVARRAEQIAITNYLDGLAVATVAGTVTANVPDLLMPDTGERFGLIMDGHWQRPLTFSVVTEPFDRVTFEQGFTDDRVYDSGAPDDNRLYIDSYIRAGATEGPATLRIRVSDAAGRSATVEEIVHIGQSAGRYRALLVEAAKAFDTQGIRKIISDISEIDRELGSDPTWMSEIMRHSCVRGIEPDCDAYLNGFLAYHIAATDDGALLDWALEWGADPNYRSSSGEPILLNTARAGKWDSVGKLLAAGANPNATGNNGGSVLLYAVGANQTDVVNRLLVAGADPNLGSVMEGMSPLHHAAANNHRDIINMLRSAGARITEDAEGHTPGWFSYWGHRDLQLALSLGYDEARGNEDRGSEPEFDWNEFMVGLNQRLEDQRVAEAGTFSDWAGSQPESEEFILDAWAMPEVFTLGSEDIETWGTPELDTVGNPASTGGECRPDGFITSNPSETSDVMNVRLGGSCGSYTHRDSYCGVILHTFSTGDFGDGWGGLSGGTIHVMRKSGEIVASCEW